MAKGRPKSQETTWGAIATALGISTKTLSVWRKHPDAPPEPSVDAWLAFQEEHGVGKGGSSELTQIKVLIARQQLKKLERENAQGEAQLIPMTEIQSFLREWAVKLDLLLTAELETNAPPLLDGKSIAEIRVTLREIHDRIRAATARGLLSWEPEQHIEEFSH